MLFLISILCVCILILLVTKPEQLLFFAQEFWEKMMKKKFYRDE